jgi:hypothetical protein
VRKLLKSTYSTEWSLSSSRQKPLPQSHTFPDGSKAEARPDGKGSYLGTLDRNVLDRLKALRGPGESYEYGCGQRSLAWAWFGDRYESRRRWI